MSRKTKKEYLEAYPWRAELWESPQYIIDKHNHRKLVTYITCDDPECENPDSIHCVYLTNLTKDQYHDGLYQCPDCQRRDRFNKSIQPDIRSKARDNTDYSLVVKSRQNRPNYYEESRRIWLTTQTPEAHAKAYRTAKENGTFMRSNMELQIEKKFGGQHSSPEFKYELDCYWPELHLGVEVDDPTHREVFGPMKLDPHCKKQGYHRAKDDYFKSLGITVLHLTFNHGDWEKRVAEFLQGHVVEPLIDLEDPTYGSIKY